MENAWVGGKEPPLDLSGNTLLYDEIPSIINLEYLKLNNLKYQMIYL